MSSVVKSTVALAGIGVVNTTLLSGVSGKVAGVYGFILGADATSLVTVAFYDGVKGLGGTKPGGELRIPSGDPAVARDEGRLPYFEASAGASLNIARESGTAGICGAVIVGYRDA